MKKLAVVIILLGTIGVQGQAIEQVRSERTDCFPDQVTQSMVPMDALNPTGISKQDFHEVLDRLEEIYQPIFSSFGSQLVIQRRWDDDQVNAFAKRSGNTWIVAMMGGLARHEWMTKEGFATVACHEIGHHIGGAPKKRMMRWASSEGQSDYFATLKCMRRYFAYEDNLKAVQGLDVPDEVTTKCLDQFSIDEDVAICERASMAGLVLAYLLNGGKEGVGFSTPDTSVVRRNQDGHPRAQCRLDTYHEASVCEMGIDQIMSQKDPDIGVCSRKFGHSVGLRPLCWYKPTAEDVLELVSSK